MTEEELVRFWKKVDKRSETECWPWIAYKDRAGYGKIRINGKSPLAHRLAWTISNGEIPNGLCVCHSCDNPTCCNPKHLWLGTPGDNARDRDAKGRTLRGEQHGSSKLTDIDVIAIRSTNCSMNGTQNRLAEKFNVSETLISSIINRRRWKHVH